MEPLLGPVDITSYVGMIDWIILGGESGAGARGLDPAWVRSIRDQALKANIPVHFKQWGEYAPGPNGLVRLGKKKAGRVLDGETWDGLPIPRVPTAA